MSETVAQLTSLLYKANERIEDLEAEVADELTQNKILQDRIDKLTRGKLIDQVAVTAVSNASSKIEGIKMIRGATGAGLKEAKEAYERAEGVM